MNKEELASNPRLDDFIVHNLNITPHLPYADDSYDAAMIIVSWLTSIVSASGQAKGSSKRSIDRPIPPGEGDFEL